MKTYPLLQSQLGVFMECIKNPSSTQYNFPISTVLPKTINLDKLEQALLQIIRVRKECRTRFVIIDGDPRQYSDDSMVIPIPRKKMTDSEAEHYIAHDFVRPYDLLSGEPLLRIEIIEGEKNNYVLFEYQHCIGDGTTMAPILTQIDLPAAYNGEELVPSEYGMYEHAIDEEASLKSEQYERAKQYYMEKFAGIDFVTLADSMENRIGMMVRESAFIPQATVDEWCKQQGTQSNLLFMAAFSLVLSKLTHQSDVAYYSINHGRMDKRLRNAYGMFVKSVPILAKVSGQQPVMDFIKSFRTELMSSIRYGVYPFNHFCSDLHQEPKVSFGFQGIAMQEYFDLEGEHCLPVQISKGMIDDDMSCVIYLKEGDYEIRMESSDALNSADTLRMVANHIKALVEYIMAHSDSLLSDVKMLTAQEEQQLFELSKGKALAIDSSATFPSLFVQQAQKTPDAPAVVDEQGTFSYGQLDNLSSALALKLRELGVGAAGAKSPFVSIMLGYEKAFLVAAIGIEKAGGAYVPLDYDYPNDRLLYMLEDSESQVLITSHAIFSEKNADGEFNSKNTFFIDDFLASAPAKTEEVNFATPDGLAYMIYTSGSTGKPKGVMIPHKAKANFVQFIAKEWGHTAKSRICCHSSFSFDASVEDLYPVLTVGGTLYTVPKEARKDLVMLHDFIVDNGITGGCYTTQLGQMLLQLYPDLPVDYLVVGGEKMTANPDCSCRLINTYGPTEFTVDATFFNVEKGKEYKNIPIGRPLYNLAAYVVDQFGHLLPQGSAGELCMAGPQIAAGYWKREELTAEKFTDCPFAEGKMYHTGDLVRYNKEGQIEYLGRIDSQVKLRGFRIELGEIESLIAAYPNILMESVQVKEIGGVQHLCAYYTASEQIDVDELKAYLSEQLTDYMVPTAYMQLNEMPLTPNGKVNTKALPMPNVQSVELVAPATLTEKKLFQLAADMLKHENFGITNNLFDMGMTSISGMRFVVSMYNDFGVQMTIKDVMQNSTIQQLAAFIDNKQQEDAINIATANAELWPQGKHYYYPITENQRGVFFDWELHPDTTQYNVPEVHVFRGGNAERLCTALKSVVNAHPYLKTRFVQHDGDVMQIRRDEESPVIVCEVLKEKPDRAFFQSRVRPFNLYHDTLYHLEVYSYGADVYLFMDIHHTIYDGASSLFLLSDIRKAYEGDTVEKESYTAFDFALDEYRFTQLPEYAEAETYFKNMLEGKEPTVYPSYASDKNDSEETTVSITLENKDIASFCKTNGLTPNSYFMSVVMHVLQSVVCDDDVVITTITNGRNDPRLMGAMGMFVKTIPVVWSANGAEGSVINAIKSLQLQLEETQSRDFYPFTKMVECYGLRPEIMYVYQPAEGIAIDDDDNMTLVLNQIKVPLDINVIPQGDQYNIILEYDKERYSHKQMERLLEMFRQVAEQVCHVEALKDVQLLSAKETATIIQLSQGEKLDVDPGKTWVDAFIQQALQTPDNIAVADKDSQYTYAELAHGSDVLATQLIQMGVQQNQFVGLLMERTKDIPLSILAIHKAGAAYLPLDMEYPAQRIQYMIENSGLEVIVTTHEAYHKTIDGMNINISAHKTVYLDDIDLTATCSPVNHTQPDGLAYMIYTSGSTGQPKGVMLHHAGLWNFTVTTIGINQLTAADRISSHRSFSFDAHIEDVFPILTVGGSIHIMPSEIRKDLDLIYDFLERHEITGGGYTTSIAQLLLKNFDLHQRFITCGGEALHDVVSDKVQIINVYGPTECTDHAAIYHLEKGRTYKVIPIGRPVSNLYCFIIDRFGRLLPQGSEGELCVAGVQVGCGYWQLPDMTEEVFTECPFVTDETTGHPLRMYHTGDICRWNEEGNLEYVGRKDRLVKLHGFRIETSDIESVAMKVEGVHIAAAEVREVGNSPALILYYVLDAGATLTEEQLRKTLDASILADFMKPSVYMQLDEMPLTPNGKVNRKELPTPTIESGQIVAAETEVEVQILAIAEELLGGERIGVTANLISAGMTSLTAMRMSAVIKQKTQLYVPVKEIMLHPTVREIASWASATQEEKQKTYAKQEYYPITENQRGVYIDWELNSDAVQYNIPEVVPMEGYSAEQIHDALIKVVEAHPYLKTRLVKKDGDVMQQRRDDAPVGITITTLDHEPTSEEFKQRVKPFNLLEEDLYRLEIIQSPSKCFLFVDIHHVINDGGSRLVFSQALEQALNGEKPEQENYTAFDYALDEREWLESASCQEAETYFDGLLSGQESTVYPHSTEGTKGKGLGNYEFTVAGKDIDAFCREIGVTSNAYFATMFSQLLHRVTREESVLFTTIDNGRSDIHLMQSIGMFVKTLPVTSILNTKDTDKTTLADSVKQMHQQLTKTRSYGFYPFTRMSERHGIQPEIMYVYHGKLAAQTTQRNKDEGVILDLDTAKLPLTVTVYSKGDDTYTVGLEYNLTLYSTADMKVLADMMAVACQSATNARSLADIKLMNDDEEKAMVAYSKGKDMDVDITKTFAQVFEERAKLVPDNMAVADKDSSLTYRQLSQYSDVLAHQLIEAGVQPNDFVCVMLDRFKEFPLSVLAIHKAGAAYTPMDFEYPNERLQYMLENSESKVLITSHHVLESKQAEGDFNIGKAKLIFIEDIDYSVEAEPINLTTPDNLAYMIYTSGSTGKPKGAMLHQAGLWNFINIVIDMERLTADDRIEGHRSFSFDAHIEDMYPILTLGGSFHIMPSEIRKDVAAMRDFLFEHQITGGGYSTAIAAMLLNTYADLPMRFITAGGEKLSGVYSDHIEIINVYGPTECTDDTSYYAIAPGNNIENIPIGRPVANSWSFIVDTAGHLVPCGVVGELCIAGIPVGRGYWRLPERTAESFVDCPFVSEDRWGRKVRMYHTGDLCRYNEQGDLEYMGRIDFQVKLRGFRIELGEIESKVLQIEGILQAAAEVKKVIGTDHLVLYYTCSEDATISDEDIRKALQQSALAEYMVPDTYVPMDVMPMTPNGKINRKALPLPTIKAVEIVPPSNGTEQQLLDMAIDLLKHDQFGVTTNLITVGMTSITAMRMSAMIGSNIGKNVPTKSILENPTLRYIASVIDGDEEIKDTQIAHIHEYREYYPITENQRGVYIAWELNRETTQYNIPQLRKYSGIKADDLREALIEIINAHPIFKARMAMVDGDVMQQRRDEVEAVVSVSQLETAPTMEFFQSRVRPFDLQNEDLYRIEIYQHGDNVYLFMDFHHIIYDGVSNMVFDNDLQVLLGSATTRDKQIEHETYTAFDRALDEQEMRESDMYPAAEKYFDTLLESFEIASYPASRQPDKAEPAPAVTSAVIAGDTVNSFCSTYGVTANSFFMTAVTQVLHRILREDDLMMSAISTGRLTAEMQNTIGFYVQTLPIVTHSSNVNVKDAVSAMQQQYIDTQSNSIFSYTKAVEKYGCRSEILFAFQAVLGTSVDETQSFKEEMIPLQLDTVKMPVLISIVNDKADYKIDIDYDASRYNQADMSQFANAIKCFIENASKLADSSVNSIPLTSTQDEQKLLALGKGDTLDYDKNQTLVDIIRQQVAATPEAIAIVFRDKHLTYRELDNLTDRLAVHLRQMGVKPEQAIGVMIDRSELMAVYPIAIMKAGAAYMPLDSHFPEERLQFMCEDAGVSLILADDGIVSQAMPHYAGKTFCASELDSLPEPAEKPVAAITPDNMFVILYTSGSTGKPKGCMLEHGNIVNFCHWYTKEFDVTQEDRAVAYANFGFDAHMMDLYPALSVGASVYIIPSDLRMDLMAMNQYIEEHQLTIAFMTTQIGYMFATSIENRSLRLLSVGGEKLQPLKKPRFRFYNGYGPTECTLYSTCYNITEDYNSSLIGRPLANYQLRVVDKHMNLVPRGIPGELVVMGVGVGRGYLNRPDMNAEKFITIDHQRAYRTGDLVRWSEDGYIDYIGRIDGQVKLRGLRIELGEIESRVAEHEAVKQVCVDVKEIGSVQNLVCYYVEKDGHHVSEEELKTWIGETLTAFMVPEFYVKMDKFPFTPNGKVNRRELPIPEAKAVEIVAPETETEHKLFDIAVEMLKTEQIGVTTSLISYGLTSLTAMRLSALLQQKLSVAIPVAELLSHPTIREIALLIDNGEAKSTKVADIFTKRAPQAGQGATAHSGNPLQPKGNPMHPKGNPMQPKGNPLLNNKKK